MAPTLPKYTSFPVLYNLHLASYIFAVEENLPGKKVMCQKTTRKVMCQKITYTDESDRAEINAGGRACSVYYYATNLNQSKSCKTSNFLTNS